MLQKQRRDLHRRVAQVYQAQYGDQCLDDYAGILARQTLDEMIATIPTPELTESFLQTPRVRVLRT